MEGSSSSQNKKVLGKNPERKALKGDFSYGPQEILKQKQHIFNRIHDLSSDKTIS